MIASYTYTHIMAINSNGDSFRISYTNINLDLLDIFPKVTFKIN